MSAVPPATAPPSQQQLLPSLPPHMHAPWWQRRAAGAAGLNLHLMGRRIVSAASEGWLRAGPRRDAGGAANGATQVDAFGTVRAAAEHAALHTPLECWHEFTPSRLPKEHLPYVRVLRRNGDVAGLPVTRMVGFFPGIEVDDVARCMLDVDERLRWDRNLARFGVLDGEVSGEQPAEGSMRLHHSIESSYLKWLGFSSRDFVYDRVVDRCGDRCWRATFTEAPPPAGAKWHGGVQARIHFQRLVIEEVDEEVWFEDGAAARHSAAAEAAQVAAARGTRMTLTACVDTGSRPPSGVIDMLCRVMSGQPYMWIRAHLDARRAESAAAV